MESLARVFKALSVEPRLRIINLLLHSGELCVCDIEAVLGCTQTKVSRHLAYLKRVGLVDDRRKGLWMLYSLAKPKTDEQREILGSIMRLLQSNQLARKDARQLMRNVEKGCCATFSIVKPQEVPTPIQLN
jgi:ArsR family transcriptional regulator